jgi:hypothetical protein
MYSDKGTVEALGNAYVDLDDEAAKNGLPLLIPEKCTVYWINSVSVEDFQQKEGCRVSKSVAAGCPISKPTFAALAHQERKRDKLDAEVQRH